MVDDPGAQALPACVRSTTVVRDESNLGGLGSRELVERAVLRDRVRPDGPESFEACQL